MITLFDERDLVSFGRYMISEQRKDSIKNNTEITNNETRKAILKTVTQFDFNNWLALKMEADQEVQELSEVPETLLEDTEEDVEDVEDELTNEDNSKIIKMTPSK